MKLTVVIWTLRHVDRPAGSGTVYPAPLRAPQWSGDGGLTSGQNAGLRTERNGRDVDWRGRDAACPPLPARAGALRTPGEGARARTGASTRARTGIPSRHHCYVNAAFSFRRGQAPGQVVITRAATPGTL